MTKMQRSTKLHLPLGTILLSKRRIKSRSVLAVCCHSTQSSFLSLYRQLLWFFLMEKYNFLYWILARPCFSHLSKLLSSFSPFFLLLLVSTPFTPASFREIIAKWMRRCVGILGLSIFRRLSFQARITVTITILWMFWILWWLAHRLSFLLLSGGTNTIYTECLISIMKLRMILQFWSKIFPFNWMVMKLNSIIGMKKCWRSCL